MVKLQFLLLDAGPIIKLFELNKWDAFIEKCDVTMTRTVAEQEVVFATKENSKDYIDLQSYEKQNRIKVIDVAISTFKDFDDKVGLSGRYEVHKGEKESLAFLWNSSQVWHLCSADHAVFSVLGFLGKAEQGISLEEVLQTIGLSPCNLEWKYTKKFRERYTHLGQADSIQNTKIS